MDDQDHPKELDAFRRTIRFFEPLIHAAADGIHRYLLPEEWERERREREEREAAEREAEERAKEEAKRKAREKAEGKGSVS